MKRILPLLTIIFISILFVLPQLYTEKMIIGADSIFHFNRFYDTAEQIRNGNFQYFVSLYGFQQSGRIVNALYGPLFAYFQGLLVLVSGSWFYYQILSNFILYVVAGLSMLLLLRHVKIPYSISIPISILFISTYSIQYWAINQGFTSWGTCIYPLCMIPMIDFVRLKKFPVIPVALSVALMTQIHLLSTFMLVLMYIPFFFCLFQIEKRKSIISLVKSILLYLFLTANIWVGMYILYRGNSLLSPFINKNMSLKSINLDGSYWLVYPMILPLLLILGISYYIFSRRTKTIVTKIVFYTSLGFLILSTSLIPWTELVKQKIPLISLIQFPFRFFVPFTLLFLLYLALVMNNWTKKRRFRFISTISIVIIISQTIGNLYDHLNQWENEGFVSRHTYLYTSADEARKSFFIDDLSISLDMLQKTTPDYIPIYKRTNHNKYDRYKEEILDRQSQFTKIVEGDSLVIQWMGDGKEKIHVPIIVYEKTILIQDGNTLMDYELTDIGTPIIKQKLGKNELILQYKEPIYFRLVLLLTLVFWLGSFCRFLYLYKGKIFFILSDM
ncbi:hypothetical protein [Enterococcus mundtii]|uniref:Cell division protein n=1 Tax=Enterococcus mundtii TaxID=53346 RepID=A0A848MVC7_ENTMU|nr:hypothetical protein [Enterococcus mundtii]NMP59536.1 hypothetical protein [Enterococcus mundtii]